MTQQDGSRFSGCHNTNGTMISRRVALGSSGLAVLGVLSGSALGREEGKGPPREMQERMEQFRAFSERMRDAGSMEERAKIMEERNAWERKRAIEDLKEQLEISEPEWTVIKPRIETVYNLVHPQQPFGRGNAQPATPVELKSRELRELLSDKGAAADRIRAGLTALRAAKEKTGQELAKARQDLRQIMTLRQEAVLVLSGLLE